MDLGLLFLGSFFTWFLTAIQVAPSQSTICVKQ